MKFIKYIGPMRFALALFAFILMGMAPFSIGASFSGWGVVVGTVAPALTIIMLFALPLDIMMSRIFMTDTEGAERVRYWRIIGLELFLIIALIIAWRPFIARLLEL
ncbi:MAG: hypothetical protein ACU4EQ_01095 [Candidatus Nitrosoglobus sp.]|jgi:hypothetical protein